MSYPNLLETVNRLDLNFLDAAKKKAAAEALDAILSLETESFNVEQFFEALKAHEGFWESLGFIVKEKDSDYTLDSFKRFQEALTLQRVRLEMKEAPDSILLAILKNNLPECDAYLKTKISPPIYFVPRGKNKSLLEPFHQDAVELLSDSLISKIAKSPLTQIEEFISADNADKKTAVLDKWGYFDLAADFVSALFEKGLKAAEDRKRDLVNKEVIGKTSVNQIHSQVLASIELRSYDDKTIEQINELLYSISMDPEKKEAINSLESFTLGMTAEQQQALVDECVAFKRLHIAYQNQRGKAGQFILKALLNGAIAMQSNDMDLIIEKINRAIDQSSDAETLIDKLSEQTQVPDEAKIKLTRSLSPELYNKIRTSRIKERLLIADMAERTTILSQIAQESHLLRKEYQELVQQEAKWSGFKSEDWDNPSFYQQMKDKPKLKQEYYNLLENASLIITRLERNESQLEEKINQLTISGAHQEVNKLRAQLVSEQQELKEAITHYKEFKNKIQTSLANTDKVIPGAELHVYQAEGITVESVSQTTLQDMREDKTNKTVPGDALAGFTRDQQVPAFQKAILKAGESFLYKVKTPLEDNTASITSFAQSRIDAKYTAYDSQKDQLSKSSGWKVELIQGPQSDGPAHEKVNYYMSMALALIKAHGGTPSKNKPIVLKGGSRQEMELLWTALMILGKEKFHFNQDALLVSSASFNPNQVMAQGFFGGATFNRSSCYHQVFHNKNAQTVLKNKLVDADDLIASRKQLPIESKKSPSSIEGFKKQMESMKTKEILQDEKAVQSSRSNPGNSI